MYMEDLVTLFVCEEKLYFIETYDIFSDKELKFGSINIKSSEMSCIRKSYCTSSDQSTVSFFSTLTGDFNFFCRDFQTQEVSHMTLATDFKHEDLNSIMFSSSQLFVQKKPNTLEVYYLAEGKIVERFLPAILNFKGENLLPAMFVENLNIVMQVEKEGQVETISLWISHFTG